MKKGAKAQLSYKWWSDNKAKSLKKTGLGKALQVYEKADRAADKHCKVEVLGIKYNALRGVKAAAQKGVGLCIPKIHAETRAALKTYDGVVQTVADPLKAEIDRVQNELARIQIISKSGTAAVDAAMKKFMDILAKMNSAAEMAEGRPDPNKARQLIKFADEMSVLLDRELQKARAAGPMKLDPFVKKCSPHVLFGHDAEVLKALNFGGNLTKMGAREPTAKNLVKRVKKGVAAMESELIAYAVTVKKMNQAAKQLSSGCALQELQTFRQGPLKGQLSAAAKVKKFDPKAMVKLWTSVDDVIDKLGDDADQKKLDRVAKLIQATENAATGAAKKIGLQV